MLAKLLAISAFLLSFHGPSQAAEVPFEVGADLSFLSRIETLGGRYKERGKETDALELFKSRGANIVRLRLWVDPDGRDAHVNDLPYTLALAKRVKAKGLRFLLDLHYSDTWADPGAQLKPVAWKELDFENLTKKVESYSRETVQAFREVGAMPDMVQIGNETPCGMLWPDGNTLAPGGWARYATLFRAGTRGVLAGAGKEKAPAILIHLNNGDTDLWKWFFKELEEKGGGAPFDAIGLSYYPESSSKMATLVASLRDLAAKYRKPILIVETNYPFAEPDATKRDKWEFPPTPVGQKAWLLALKQTLREVPDGLGRGLIWWAPEWVPVPGLSRFYGPRMLFTDDFEALPALDALSAAPR